MFNMSPLDFESLEILAIYHCRIFYSIPQFVLYINQLFRQFLELSDISLFLIFITEKCDADDKGSCNLWTVLDLVVFIVMGFFGGLLGALFNYLNTKLTIYRMKHLTADRKFRR